MEKRQYPFDVRSIEQTAEDYIRGIDFRIQQKGMTPEEAVAEIQAEEEAEREAADYIRIVFELPFTVCLIHKKRKNILGFLSQVLRDAPFELISLSKMTDVNGFWLHLLRLDLQVVWVINEIEQAKDIALQSIICAMLRRERYAPSGFPAIDFATIRLVLAGTAEDMPVCFNDLSSFENTIEVMF
ncbi:hypothetical protein [Bacteroides gallinaceum]|uniref:hypothetical protein n=1 Tax=Bacteroides gallinaceum TaxID=1462571 RepID=UPI0025AB139D|nr:hypothetical protein [Bacteroides gallinaceum]MDN0066369.1 hypothetical protein [Bacteroides gallinaceum]